MINNRLFKKINSIFWGLVSWMPVFVIFYYILCYSISIEVTDLTNFTFGIFTEQIFNGFNEVLNMFNNNLITYFFNFLELFGDVGEQPFSLFVLIVLAWFCMVQVFRLLAYVFVWFIDLIISLFDLMTFNRKGDN